MQVSSIIPVESELIAIQESFSLDGCVVMPYGALYVLSAQCSRQGSKSVETDAENYAKCREDGCKINISLECRVYLNIYKYESNCIRTINRC